MTPWPRGCRPLRWPEEVDELQGLVYLCHPERSPRSDLHYFAHPTIVSEDASGSLVAYAVLSMAPVMDVGGVPVPCVYLMDTGVHPRARGAGLGRHLLLLRCAIGRQCGAILAAGTVRIDNREMAAIHKEVGMEPRGDILHGIFTDVTPPADGRLMIAPPEVLDAAVEATLHDPVRRWDRP